MTKLYLCTYQYEGKKYSFHIPAESADEAQWRLNAIGSSGKVDGELKFTKQEQAT
jgi:hypothetical protein